MPRVKFTQIFTNSITSKFPIEKVNGDLVMLQSEEGKALQKVAEKEVGTTFLSLLPSKTSYSGQM